MLKLKKIGSMQLAISGSIIMIYLAAIAVLVDNWKLSISISVFIWLLLAGFVLLFAETFILSYLARAGYSIKSKCLGIELPTDISSYSRDKRCWHYLFDASIISIFWLIVDAFSWHVVQSLIGSVLVLPFSVSMFFFTNYISTEITIMMRNHYNY